MVVRIVTSVERCAITGDIHTLQVMLTHCASSDIFQHTRLGILEGILRLLSSLLITSSHLSTTLRLLINLLITSSHLGTTLRLLGSLLRTRSLLGNLVGF